MPLPWRLCIINSCFCDLQAAKSAGYVYFAIQYWGECWTGSEAHLTYDMHGESSTGCWQDTVGKGGYNFVYQLTGSAGNDVSFS